MSQYSSGLKAFTAGEDLEARSRVKKSGATVVYADAGEDFIGVTEAAVDSGDVVTVKLKNVSGTFKVRAAEAFAVNTPLYGADNGEVADTESGSVQFYSLELASAENDIVEAMPWSEVAGIGSINIDSGYNFSLGAFSSLTQGSGAPISTTNACDFNVYSDDVGAAIATSCRGVLSRFLLTVDQAGGSIRALQGQLKLATGVDMTNGIYTAVQGYVEMAGTHSAKTGSTFSCVDASMEIGTALTVDSGGEACGVHVETTGSGTITNNGTCAGILVDKASGAADWPVGVDISNSTTALDIGACTTGISFTGDATTAISIGAGCTPTDGILIAGACADGIHLSGTNTAVAIHVSGDQVDGVLMDIDEDWESGVTMSCDTTKTCTAGLEMSGAGTFTTGILLSATAITTGITLSAGSMTDGIKISGTTPVDGIEISSACSANAINISGASAKGITITGATTYAIDIATSGVFRMGVQDTGVDLTTNYPFAMDVQCEANADITAGATGSSAGIYSRYAIETAATSQCNHIAVFAKLRPKANLADGVHAALYAVTEISAGTIGGTATTQTCAGHFSLDYSPVSITTGHLNGIVVDSSVATGGTMSATMSGIRIKKSTSKLAWTTGIQLENSACTTGIAIGTCTTGMTIGASCTSALQIGAAATSAGSGITVNAAAPVGFYFDDGGAALTAWSECMTVGLVLPTASTGATQTGFPSCLHAYIDQRANYTGPTNKSMTALWAGYLVRNSSTLDGFDNGCVSAMQCSVDVDTGSTLAAGTTLAGIQFGGNWSAGTVSGYVVPMAFTTTNADWNGFFHITSASAEGLYQGSAATGGTKQYLRVYINGTLYTIEMDTA